MLHSPAYSNQGARTAKDIWDVDMKKNLISGAFAIMLTAAIPTIPTIAFAGEMAGMPGMQAQAAQKAEGKGVIKKIDAKKSTITLAHGPIAALKWPAMTMTFPVQSADLLKGLTLGAGVHFVLVSHDGHPMISEIHPL